MAKRHSGLQGDVLQLYRHILRTARGKDDATYSFARERFRGSAASVKRSDFKKIEFLLRQGHKRLKLLSMPGMRSAGSVMGGTQQLQRPKRTFSSSSSSSSLSSSWNVPGKPRVHVVSLGCGRNWVDSEVMLGQFLHAGYEIEPEDPTQADLLVVNTCGFLGSARDEGDSVIREMCAVKEREEGRDVRVMVTGCMVNLERDAVLKRHPEIDHLVGAAGIGKVLHAVEQDKRMLLLPVGKKLVKRRQQQREQVQDAGDNDENSLEFATTTSIRSHLEEALPWEINETESPFENHANGVSNDTSTDLALALAAGEAPNPRVIATPPHLAYLKIAEGCRKRCSFCIIPKIKGPLRSKPPRQILREYIALRRTPHPAVAKLQSLESGVVEVSLIAQDLGDYGKDATRHGDKEGSALVRLLKDLVSAEEHLLASSSTLEPAWIRLLYLYPDEITKDLVDTIVASRNIILPYVDMPIQHVSARILKSMGRGVKYDRARLEETLRLLEIARPPEGEEQEGVEWGIHKPSIDANNTGCGIAVRTTLMVGFPGETEAEFQELLAFVEEWGGCRGVISHVGIFEFEAEAGAAAATMPNQVPASVKRERRLRLEAVCARNMEHRHKAMVERGQRLVVLVDQSLISSQADLDEIMEGEKFADNDAGETVRQEDADNGDDDDDEELVAVAVGRHSGQALDVDGVVTLFGSPVDLGHTADMAQDDSFALQLPRPGEKWVVDVVASEGANLFARLVCRHSPLRRTKRSDPMHNKPNEGAHSERSARSDAGARVILK